MGAPTQRSSEGIELTDDVDPPIETEASQVLEKSPTLDDLEIDTLIEEVNVLDLEGYLFNFDPKHTGHRSGRFEFELRSGRSLTLRFDAEYGQPSILAYRILQVVFKKLTEEGRPFPDTVSFSQRELARLVVAGKTFGGYQSQKIYKAISQLRHTDIHAEMFDKATGEWSRLEFYLFPSVLYSGRKAQIHTCSIRVDQAVVESLNNRHWACFNWDHLRTLEPISMAIYKRLFRHFSNLYGHSLTRHRIQQASLTTDILKEARAEVSFEKAYEAICREWLGGLTAYRYKSDVRRRLGAHIDAVKHTGLVRSWSIEDMTRGRGFKIVFRPGIGFFREYDAFYQSDWQPQIRFKESADRVDIQYPLQALSHFYAKRHGVEAPKNVFPKAQHEVARELIEQYGYDAVIELIDFTVAEAQKTNFDMKSFGAVRQYVAEWEGQRVKNAKLEKLRQEERKVALRDHQTSRYRDYVEAHVAAYKQSLSGTALARLEAEAAEQHSIANPDVPKNMINLGVSIFLQRLLTEQSEPLPLEAWLEHQQSS